MKAPYRKCVSPFFLAVLFGLLALAGCQQLPLPLTNSASGSVWTGFLEGQTVDISTEVGGRLTTMTVNEGDSVQAQQPLAALDDELIRLRVDLADANIAAADAQVDLVRAGARAEDILRAEARVDQARAALDAADQALSDATAIRANPQSLRVAQVQGQLRAEVAARQFDAAVAQAQAADLENSFWQDQVRILWDGAEIRLPDGTTRHFNSPNRRVEFAQEEWNRAGNAAWQAWAAVTQAQASRDAAAAAWQDVQEQVSNPIALDVRVDQARGTRDRTEANLQAAQAALQVLRDGASPAQLQAARAAADQARAVRASLDNELAHYQINAPRAGTVSRVYYRVGEIAPAGAPLIQLSVEGDLTLRVFIPMSQVDKIHLGDAATITLPELNNRTVPATISYIADRAEFTGRQAQTDSERNAQLLAVELTLKNPDPKIQAGMPGSVSFDAQPLGASNPPTTGSRRENGLSAESSPPAFSGTLEARETRIASEVAARTLAVHYVKGDTVQRGNTLIDLDNRDIQDAENEAEAAVRASEANLAQVQEQARPGTLALADAGMSQAQADLDSAQRAAVDAQRALDSAQDLTSQIHVWEGKLSAAQGDVTAAEAKIAGLQNEIELARRDLSAAGKTRLAVLQKTSQAAEANRLAAQATLQGNRRVLELYRAILKNPLELVAAQHAGTSQVKVARAGVAVAGAEREVARRGPQVQSVALAQAKLRAAQVNLRWVQAQARRFIIASPLGGTLVAREIEPGEITRPGSPLLTIADMRELQVTFYIPVRSLTQVYIGQPAAVRLPSLPGKTFAGKIEYIAPEAEFKPANVYNSQERSEMVFSVRVHVNNSQGELKAGLPADVTLQ